jgi:hypothetical protein
MPRTELTGGRGLREYFDWDWGRIAPAAPGHLHVPHFIPIQTCPAVCALELRTLLEIIARITSDSVELKTAPHADLPRLHFLRRKRDFRCTGGTSLARIGIGEFFGQCHTLPLLWRM